MARKFHRFLFASVGLLVVGAAVVLWRERERTCEAEADRAALRWQRERLLARTRALEGRFAKAERETVTRKDLLEKAEAAAKAREQARPVTNRATASETDTWLRKIHRDPEVQALHLMAGRPRWAGNFEPLFRELGVTRAQAETFLANFERREAKDADLVAAVESLGLSEEDPAALRLHEEVRAEFEAAQRALLGEAGYQRSEEFERSTPARDAVRGLAGVAVDAGVPLTRLQAEQLAQVLIESAHPTRPEGWLMPKTMDWARVDERARTILSEAQFALFQTTEPSLDGQGSRFMGRVGRLIEQAQNAEATAGTVRPGG